MTSYEAKVIIKLADDVKDVRGIAIDAVFCRLGIEDKANTRQGKFFSFCINADNDEAAKQKLEYICKEVLSNPVIETYKILSLEVLK